MKRKSVLIINVCKEKLHELEFVKPICGVLDDGGVKYFVRHYLNLKKGDLKKTSCVIICGTSLKDNKFMGNVNRFDWIKEFKGKILGICAGMQIIGMVFGGVLRKGNEIGFEFEDFKKSFFGLGDCEEVYHLHNYYLDTSKLKEFENFTKGNKVCQAFKHKGKQVYGCLFHPEVRQKQMIVNFIKS